MRLVAELVITPPDSSAILICGVPDLGAVEAAAVLADQFGGQGAFSAVGVTKSLSSCKLRLHMIPLVRLDDVGVAALHIILGYFALVGLHLLLQKIHRERLLKERISFVLLIGENTVYRSLTPSLLPTG